MLYLLRASPEVAQEPAEEEVVVAVVPVLRPGLGAPT